MTRPDIDRAAVISLRVERARRMGLPIEAEPQGPSPELRRMLHHWWGWWLHGVACGACAALLAVLILDWL